MIELTPLIDTAWRSDTGIEPAAAALAPGRGPVLLAAFTEPGADPIRQLGRERPAPDPGEIRLHDSDDVVDLGRGHPAADTRSGSRGIGRGDIRVGPVVEIQEGALRAFEEHLGAIGQRILDQPGRIGHQAAEGLSPADGLAVQGIDVETPGRASAQAGEERLLLGDDPLEPGSQSRGIEQVLDPQPDAQRAVGIRRTDTTASRADFPLGQPILHRAVEGQVVRHDDVRPIAHPESVGPDPATVEHGDLVEEDARIEDDAVTDHGRHVGMEHPRRHEVQLEHLLAEGDRVAGVVTALVADDIRTRLRQDVDRLALALVAPLEPDEHGSRHQRATKKPTAVVPWAWLDLSRRWRRTSGVEWSLIGLEADAAPSSGKGVSSWPSGNWERV